MVICIFCFCPYRYTVLHMLPIDSINPTSNTSSGPFHPWKRNLVDLLRKMTRNNKLGSNTHNLSQIHMRSMNRGELRSASPHELRASGFHLPSHQEHPEPIEAALHFWKPSCESIVILDLYWEYPVFFFCSTFIQFFSSPVFILVFAVTQSWYTAFSWATTSSEKGSTRRSASVLTRAVSPVFTSS